MLYNSFVRKNLNFLNFHFIFFIKLQLYDIIKNILISQNFKYLMKKSKNLLIGLQLYCIFFSDIKYV